MKKLMILFVILAGTVGTFAQKGKTNDPKYKAGTVLTTYSCPMHPDITSDEPGKCSKCGMALNLSKKEQLKWEVVKLYSCSMHTEIVSDKPGKCSKCGMDLNLSKKEQLKWETVKLYSCPMHPDVVTEKNGTCPKCGMKLTEKKQSSTVNNNN